MTDQEQLQANPELWETYVAIQGSLARLKGLNQDRFPVSR
jgi:hypothetical protein